MIECLSVWVALALSLSLSLFLPFIGLFSAKKGDNELHQEVKGIENIESIVKVLSAAKVFLSFDTVREEKMRFGIVTVTLLFTYWLLLIMRNVLLVIDE